MSRIKAGSILFVAAAALLGIFLVRDTADRPIVRSPGLVSVEQAAPVADTSRPEGAVVVRTPLQHFQDSKADAEPLAAAPAQEAGGAAEEEDANPHPGSKVTEATIRKLHGEQPLTAEHPHMKSAIEIQERNNGWLMAHPAIVGTAVGLNDKGEVALIVYTRVEAPELPKAIENLPVATYRSGEFFARTRKQDASAAPVAPRRPGQGGGGTGGGSTSFDPTLKHRPAPIGVSTGHPDITAGTIGCRVTRTEVVNGQSVTTYYALSNNHVYANQNLAQLGDKVIQPGDYDGGISPGDAIGTLAKFKDIEFDGADNTIDAAIALLPDPSILLKSSPPEVGYGTPGSTPVGPAVGASVRKYGRTTKLTRGTISAINGTVNVGYDFGTARFVGQVFISNYKGTKFSAGGDSGSLIVSFSSANSPVALLFAGSQTTTIGNPIGAVLAEMGVSVDGQ